MTTDCRVSTRGEVCARGELTDCPVPTRTGPETDTALRSVSANEVRVKAPTKKSIARKIFIEIHFVWTHK